MKVVLILFITNLFFNASEAQNKIWKQRICRQEGFYDRDSILFCKIFDSLNREYSINRIILFKNNKNRFIPILGNTILLKDTSYAFVTWVEEMSHAIQFDDRRNYYKLKFCSEVLVVLWRFLFQNKKYRYRRDRKISYWGIYDNLYFEKRSFEYEAHEIIEPKIFEFIRYRMKKTPL